jgi:spore germination cell wall hydrolase CwlJ-like protein
MRYLSFTKLILPLTKAFMATSVGALAAEAKTALTDYERQIVAAVLVLEAADQGETGMRAVLHVIDNRAGHVPARAIGVVARRKAFSCLNAVTSQRHPDYGPVLRRAMKDRTWPFALQMVRDYEAGRLGPDITGGATHYCIHPPASWERSFTFLAQIGDHRFYR